MSLLYDPSTGEPWFLLQDRFGLDDESDEHLESTDISTCGSPVGDDFADATIDHPPARPAPFSPSLGCTQRLSSFEFSLDDASLGSSEISTQFEDSFDETFEPLTDPMDSLTLYGDDPITEFGQLPSTSHVPYPLEASVYQVNAGHNNPVMSRVHNAHSLSLTNRPLHVNTGFRTSIPVPRSAPFPPDTAAVEWQPRVEARPRSFVIDYTPQPLDILRRIPPSPNEQFIEFVDSMPMGTASLPTPVSPLDVFANPAHLQPIDDSKGTVAEEIPKKRTRRSFKEVEVGNNRFGRNGTLRCEQCRRRNSKCIFTHKWKQCEFCRSRNISTPCIKRRGPRTEAESNQSPQFALRAPDNVIVDSDDGLIFQYACSEEFYKPRSQWFVVRLIRNFISEYGEILHSTSLRHAILALAASELPSDQFERKRADHAKNTSRALLRTGTGIIDDADLLAGVILSWVAKAGSERTILMNRVLSIFHTLQATRQKHSTSGPSTAHPINVSFTRKGFTLEEIRRHPGLYRLFTVRFPTMEECFQSQVEVCDDYGDTTIPVRNGPPDVRKLSQMLYCIYWNMVRSLPLLVEKNCDAMTDENSHLTFMMDKWKSELETLLCQNLQKISDQAVTSRIGMWRQDPQLHWACLRHSAVRFLYVLLSGTTIIEALQTPDAVSAAWELVMLSKITNPIPLDEDGTELLREYIFLGGLALPACIDSLSKVPFDWVANVASTWVINYLRAGDNVYGHDDFKLGDRLMEFWHTWDIRLMIRVLQKLVF